METTLELKLNDKENLIFSLVSEKADFIDCPLAEWISKKYTISHNNVIYELFWDSVEGWSCYMTNKGQTQPLGLCTSQQTAQQALDYCIDSFIKNLEAQIKIKNMLFCMNNESNKNV